jgi:nitrite reductase/ring-hydroxylating ferredoxin subunit
MNQTPIAVFDDLEDLTPQHAVVGNTDLVVIRYGDEVSVLYGRCLHRGALLADGHIEGENLICGVHSWDFRFDTGISEYNPAERLKKFSAWVEDGAVLVDADEIAAWEGDNPQPYDRKAYQGAYQDVHGTPEEPHVHTIHELAGHGLDRTGAHGPVAAMGVPRQQLPSWDDLQFLTAQLHKFPLLDDVPVGTDLLIGPRAKQPLRLEIPLFVSDMSFGALSEEAKVALARGAELAGTGICSGEGGMLPEEQASSTECRRFTSRVARVPRQARADTCRARRSRGKSRKCEGSWRASPRCLRPGFQTGRAWESSVTSRTRCGSTPAGFPLA